MLFHVDILHIWYTLSIVLPIAQCLHLKGTWNPASRFKFLTKFGFQRTQVDEIEASRGYVYGNIFSTDPNLNATNIATLVLVDSQYIIDLYGNATEPIWVPDKSLKNLSESIWQLENERCHRMFEQIDAIAWHRTCVPNGQLDLMRSAPCPLNQPCSEEDNMARLINNYQFTYTVQDLRQPRYWYLSLVACARDPITCKWVTTSVQRPGSSTSNTSVSLSYNIWLVNGAPHLQDYNKFEHQFSFEAHDTVEIFLVFLVLYVCLLILSHCKITFYNVIHTWLFFIQLWLSVLGTLLSSIHLCAFAFDGNGLGSVSAFGTLVSQWADALFLMLLISTAYMGIAPSHPPGGKISRAYHRLSNSRKRSLDSVFNPSDINSSEMLERNPAWPVLTCMAVLFLLTKSVLYLWAYLDQDPVIDFSVWNTVPGCLLLAVRFCVAFWFLSTLRHRQLQLDTNSDLSEGFDESQILGPNIDLVRFAAGFLLWIIVLPLVVFMAETSVSSLWRNKMILSVCFSADFVASSAYAYFLYKCCKRSG